MTTAADTAFHPFKVGLTLKAASGYDAEWLTPAVYGTTGEEVAKRVVELVKALADNGVIDLVSQAAVKMRESHVPNGGGSGSAPKTFQGGKVVRKAAPKAAAASDSDCPHGRKLVDKGSWAAMFCQAQDKGDQCEPLWKQKDGSFA